MCFLFTKNYGNTGILGGYTHRGFGNLCLENRPDGFFMAECIGLFTRNGLGDVI
jgi:hypothetical protein